MKSIQENRPFAVFDIDGTLIRWQLYHAITERLIDLNYIDHDKLVKLNIAKKNWEHRVNKSAYRNYESQLVNYLNDILTTIPTKIFETVCLDVFNFHKNRVYRYTSDLIKQLKSKNYLLFLISGSPDVIVKMIARYYQFDDYGGSKLIKNELFLNHYEIIMTHENKASHLNELVSQHFATFNNSIGIGDSDGDIELLKLVEHPIAFNPNDKLLDHAMNNGWEIVIERKNVIYKLEFKNGNYILANSKK